MEFTTGCHTARRMAEAGTYTGRIVMGAERQPGEPVYRFGAGVFYDDGFDYTGRKVEGVTAG